MYQFFPSFHRNKSEAQDVTEQTDGTDATVTVDDSTDSTTEAGEILDRDSIFKII